MSKVKSYLKCPRCQGTRFNPFTTGMIIKKDVDFIKPVKLIEPQQVLVCVGCGYDMKKHQEPMKTQIVIITGESIGYRKRAILAMKFELPENLDWKDFIVIKNILFVTKKTWKSPPPELVQFLADKNIHPYDVSDGNFDLIRGLFKLDSEHNE